MNKEGNLDSNMDDNQQPEISSSSVSGSSTTLDDYLPCYLAGVEVYNFKSYHQRHIIGPFTDLTGIIGPNGSGKSNLMDAISFALVVKSDKLRAKNLSKLINDENIGDDGGSGDENGNISGSLPLAYVKLYFVSRRLTNMTMTFQRSLVDGHQDDDGHRRCTSIYHINEEPSEKSLYQATLERLGFKVKNNFFLIFQNIIDKMVTQDPHNFTMLLEEMSGSLTFKPQYDKLKSKCEQLEKELKTLSKRRLVILKSKKFIDNLEVKFTKSSDLVHEIEVVQTKLILLELYNVQIQMEKSRQELDSCLVTISESDVQLDRCKKEKKRLEQKSDQAQKEMIRVENEIRQMELEQLFELRIVNESNREEVDRIENRMKNARTNQDKLLFEKKANKEIVENLPKEIQKLETEIAYVQNKIDKKLTQLDPKMIDEYKRLKETFQSEKATIDQKYHDLDVWKKNLIDQKNYLQVQLQSLTIDVDDEPPEKHLTTNIQEVKQEHDQLLLERKHLSDELKKIRKERYRLQEELDRCTETMAQKYLDDKKSEGVEKKQQYLQYLMKNYPGVYGRLHQLCAPVDPQYEVAIFVVMKRYLNAIVVDSFKTVQKIFQNEISNPHLEVFLSLDMIRVPVIKEALRHIVSVPDVHLVYDLVKQKKPCAEKAIRFVVGNTLLAPTKEAAAKVAFDLGDGKRYNCVSVDGTFFQANGTVFGDLVPKHKIRWTTAGQQVTSYGEVVQGKKQLQKSLVDLVAREDEIRERLEKIETKIDSCTAEMESLEKLEQRRTDKLEKRREIKMKIDALQKQQKEIENKLEEHAEAFEKYQEELTQAEQKVFGQFLSRWNLMSLKQVEEIYFDTMDDDQKHLNDCQIRLKGLRVKLIAEETKTNKIEENVQKWTTMLEDEKGKLEQARKKWEKQQHRLKKVETEMEKLRDMLTKWRNKWEKLETKVQKMADEMEQLRSKLGLANKSVVKLRSMIDNILSAKRHEILKRAHVDEIVLPFNNAADNALHQQIFANIFDQSQQEIYAQEEQLDIDFDRFPEIKQFNNDHEFRKLKSQLETQLNRLEDEIVAVPDSSFPAKKTELVQNLMSISRKIRECRKAFNEQLEKFKECKHRRLDLFNSFFESASINLNFLYKELMQSNAAQAFLVQENPEEPYLGGIYYHCIVPGKIFQPTTCLSGSEKILAAFIFIFSMYMERFPTFFIMDEIDGQLDNENIFKLMEFLKSKMAYTQFILISLKPELYCQCQSLIGVCRKKTRNGFKSQALSLDIRQFE